MNTKQFEVKEGLWVLPLETPTLPPAKTTNLVLLRVDAGLLLIDPATPYAEEQKKCDSILGVLAQDLKPIAILLTHGHPDHVQDAPRLRDIWRIPILSHKDTQPYLNFPLDGHIDAATGILDISSESLRVIETPGHAQGHICLYDQPKRALIVGDMVATDSTILIDPLDGDLELYLHSLERLQQIDADTIIPAHGAPTGLWKIEETLQHRVLRLKQIEEALSHPLGLNFEDLCAHIYQDTPKKAMWLAERSLQSALIFLMRLGRIRLNETNGHYFVCDPIA